VAREPRHGPHVLHIAMLAEVAVLGMVAFSVRVRIGGALL